MHESFAVKVIKVTFKVPKKKKKNGRPPKSRGGRPPIVTDEVIQKLRQAYMWDCTDEEACLYAEISTSTLYNFQSENPEFLEHKKQWKQSPVMVARRSVVEKMEKDGDLAMKYLERKVKNEFSTRTDVHGNMTFNRMPLITVDGTPMEYDFGKEKLKENDKNPED